MLTLIETEHQARKLAFEPRLHFLADRILTLTGATGSAIAVADSQQERLESPFTCRARAGVSAPKLGAPLSSTTGLSGLCLRSNQIVLCSDAWNDDRVDRQVCRRLNIRSVLAVPLHNGQQVIGLIEALSSQPSAFTAADMDRMKCLAQLVLEPSVELVSAAVPMTVGEMETPTGGLLQTELEAQTETISEPINAPINEIIKDEPPAVEMAPSTAAETLSRVAAITPVAALDLVDRVGEPLHAAPSAPLAAAIEFSGVGIGSGDEMAVDLASGFVDAPLATERQLPSAPTVISASADQAPTAGETAAGETAAEETAADRLAKIGREIPAPIAPKPVAQTAPHPRVGTVNEHSQNDLLQPGPEPELLVFQSMYPQTSHPVLKRFALAALLLAVAAAAGYWWVNSNSEQPPASNLPPAPAATPQAFSMPSSSAPVGAGATASLVPDPARPVSVSIPQASNSSPQVSPSKPPISAVPYGPQKLNAIHTTQQVGTTVVQLDLSGPVHYEAHRLTDPERIYFDLQDTDLAAQLPHHLAGDGTHLLRIRTAITRPGVTRVVLDTHGIEDYQVQMDSNPYRLRVEIRTTAGSPPGATQITAQRSSPALDRTHPVTQSGLQVVTPQHTPLRSPLHAPIAAGTIALPAIASAPALPRASRTARTRLKVFLDPGHGGWDMGTIGNRGLMEKDLALEVAQRLGQLLEKNLGCEVVLTRQDDSYIPLDQRALAANDAGADLFISIHANYSSATSARGVETYYPEAQSGSNIKSVRTEDSRRLAELLQIFLHNQEATSNPGLPDRGVKSARFAVLATTAMPAVLAEVSFVSSPSDEKQLIQSSYRQQIAQALYRGIASYVAQRNNKLTASAGVRPAGQ